MCNLQDCTAYGQISTRFLNFHVLDEVHQYTKFSESVDFDNDVQVAKQIIGVVLLMQKKIKQFNLNARLMDTFILSRW